MRKHYSPEFKAKIALEAIKGLKTVTQIASDFDIHSARVSEWKNELLEKVPTLFQNNQVVKDLSAEKESSLYQQIGQLACEVEWLKKKLGNYRMEKEEI